MLPSPARWPTKRARPLGLLVLAALATSVGVAASRRARAADASDAGGEPPSPEAASAAASSAALGALPGDAGGAPSVPTIVSPFVPGALADAGSIFIVRADVAFPPPQPQALLPDAGSASADDLVALSDFAPIFVPEGSAPLYAPAKAAFDRGQYPEALALLDRESAKAPLIPEAAFLRAIALFRVGLSSEAARAFLTLADQLPPLRSRCRFSAALALQAQGAMGPAAELFAEIPPESPAFREAQLLEARARMALGKKADLDRAASELGPLSLLPPPVSGFGRDLGAEALLALATLEGQRGHGKVAAHAYRELWLGHPLSPLAAEAQLEAEALGAAPPTSAELVTRAELLLSANRNQPALDALRPLAKQLELKGRPAGPGRSSAQKRTAALSVACEAHFALAKALRKQRHHSDALVEFDRVLEECRGGELSELRQKALYLAGQSAAVVEPPRAKGLFAELAEGFPQSALADDALFFLAEVEAKNLEDPASARKVLQQLVETYPGGDYAAEARFKLFWLARAAGETQTGLGQLKVLGQAGPSTLPRPSEPTLRARYWAAQVESDGPLLLKLANTWPGNYYADMARSAVHSAATPAAAPPAGPIDPSAETGGVLARADPPRALHAGSLREAPNFRTGLALLRLGLWPQAAEEFGHLDRSAISGPTGRAEPLLLLSLALAKAGDLRGGHAIAKGLIENPAGLPEGTAAERASFARLLFDVAYPRAFRPEIERWAQAAGVPPDLLQGLMREESALDPSALSGAGAIGLCQLMPSTGKREARRLGLGNVSTEALLQPALNIHLGAAYLGDLLKRYQGRQPLAVAAYNAGEGAVDRWLAAAPGEALDAFVEEIPIAETRHYVKRVLTSAAVYRTLPPPPPAVAQQ